jgi:hypothetical protein
MNAFAILLLLPLNRFPPGLRELHFFSGIRILSSVPGRAEIFFLKGLFWFLTTTMTSAKLFEEKRVAHM